MHGKTGINSYPSAIPIREDLTYDERLINILDRKIWKTLSQVDPDGLLLSNYSAEEATWEMKQDMLKQHPSEFN